MRIYLFLLLFSTIVCAQKGRIEIFDITASELGGTRTVRIYLPDGYDKSSKKYPVLYMHDAQNLFDAKTSFAGEWEVDETLDSLKAEIIVVGIDHGNDKRLDELTPFPNEKYGGGKADDYLKFLTETLIPAIDKKYRTKSDRRNTAIGGSSLGGLISYYAMLKYPKVFGKALVMSPSFWFSDKIYDLTQQQKKIRGEFYFVAGDSESDTMVADMQRMIEILSAKAKGSVVMKMVTGGKHNEKLWRESFASAYLYLFSQNRK